MKRKHFRWASAAGRAVVERLDAYGEMRRYESAGEIPALTTASGGGGRSKPGDMPGGFLRAWDVELSLREWGVAPGCRLLRLLDHMWTFGREELVVAVRYVLADNDDHGALRMTPAEIRERGEPGRYIQRIEEKELVSTYDLDAFDDPHIDAAATSFAPPLGSPEDYMEARSLLLSLLLNQFAAFMAERRDLPLARDAARETEPSRAVGIQPYNWATESELDEAARILARRDAA